MNQNELRRDGENGGRADEGRRRRLERLAWLLDNSIEVPGLRYRIGIASLLAIVMPGKGGKESGKRIGVSEGSLQSAEGASQP